MVALDGLVDDGVPTSGPRRQGEGRHDADAGRDGQLGQPARVRARRVRRRTARTTSGCATRRAATWPGKDIDSLVLQRGEDACRPSPCSGASTRTRRPPQPGDAGALLRRADDRRDEAIVRSITVPTGADAKLTFDAFWNEEQGWDFGFAQISDRRRRDVHEPRVHRHDVRPRSGRTSDRGRERPGFTGFSEAFRPQTCSLADVRRPDRAARVPGVQRSGHARHRPERRPRASGSTTSRSAGRSISDGSTPRRAGSRSPRSKPNTVDGFTVWIVSIDTEEGRRHHASGSSSSTATSRSRARRKVAEVRRQEGRLRRRDRLLRRPDGDAAPSTRRTRSP